MQSPKRHGVNEAPKCGVAAAGGKEPPATRPRRLSILLSELSAFSTTQRLSLIRVQRARRAVGVPARRAAVGDTFTFTHSHDALHDAATIPLGHRSVFGLPLLDPVGTDDNPIAGAPRITSQARIGNRPVKDHSPRCARSTTSQETHFRLSRLGAINGRRPPAARRGQTQERSRITSTRGPFSDCAWPGGERGNEVWGRPPRQGAPLCAAWASGASVSAWRSPQRRTTKCSPTPGSIQNRGSACSAPVKFLRVAHHPGSTFTATALAIAGPIPGSASKPAIAFRRRFFLVR